jgi:DNA-binding transcriptional LysR family regulator
LAQKSLAELDTATSRIGRSDSQASQSLKSLSFGAPPLVSANIITHAIKEFRAHRPNLRVQLFDEGSPVILQMVHTGKVDMGLGMFPAAPGVRRAPSFGFLS